MTKLDLQPGDWVVVHPGSYNGHPTIHIVDRVTPSGRIVVGKRTYRPDGDECGERDRSSLGTYGWIKPASDTTVRKIMAEQKHRNHCGCLRAVKWENFPIDILARIMAIVAEVTP